MNGCNIANRKIQTTNQTFFRRAVILIFYKRKQIMTNAIDTIVEQKRTEYFSRIISDDTNLRTWWFILDRSDLKQEEKQFILKFSCNYVRQYVENKPDQDYFSIRLDRFVAKEIRHNIHAIYTLKGWNTRELR